MPLSFPIRHLFAVFNSYMNNFPLIPLCQVCHLLFPKGMHARMLAGTLTHTFTQTDMKTQIILNPCCVKLVLNCEEVRAFFLCGFSAISSLPQSSNGPDCFAVLQHFLFKNGQAHTTCLVHFGSSSSLLHFYVCFVCLLWMDSVSLFATWFTPAEIITKAKNNYWLWLFPV
jgi:hypothetical protein